MSSSPEHVADLINTIEEKYRARGWYLNPDIAITILNKMWTYIHTFYSLLEGLEEIAGPGVIIRVLLLVDKKDSRYFLFWIGLQPSKVYYCADICELFSKLVGRERKVMCFEIGPYDVVNSGMLSKTWHKRHLPDISKVPVSFLQEN